MHEFSYFFYIFGNFLILVPFDILSFYPNIDSSEWLQENVEWIIEKVFIEKLMV